MGGVQMTTHCRRLRLRLETSKAFIARSRRMWESKSDPPTSSPPTTRWSLVLAATDAAHDARKSKQAFDELCRTYWQPVYRFIVRRGYSPADAEDLAQEFFLRLSNLEL